MGFLKQCSTRPLYFTQLLSPLLKGLQHWSGGMYYIITETRGKGKGKGPCYFMSHAGKGKSIVLPFVDFFFLSFLYTFPQNFLLTFRNGASLAL